MEASQKVEEDEGQELEFAEDEIIVISDDDTQKSNNAEEDEEVTNVDERGIVIKQMKDGKTIMVFSGEQQNMAPAVAENIKKKFEKSKKTELVDFRVWKQKH